MSHVAKRSVTIRGHRTSISLEQPFFEELEKEATRRNLPLATLITEIDASRPQQVNLSSAIRLYILSQLQRRQS